MNKISGTVEPSREYVCGNRLSNYERLLAPKHRAMELIKMLRSTSSSVSSSSWTIFSIKSEISLGICSLADSWKAITSLHQFFETAYLKNLLGRL